MAGLAYLGTPHRERVLRALWDARRPLSSREIAEATGEPASSICHTLRRLAEAEVVERSGPPQRYRYRPKVVPPAEVDTAIVRAVLTWLADTYPDALAAEIARLPPELWGVDP